MFVNSISFPHDVFKNGLLPQGGQKTRMFDKGLMAYIDSNNMLKIFLVRKKMLKSHTFVWLPL